MTYTKVDRAYTHGGNHNFRSWDQIKGDIEYAKEQIERAYPGWYARPMRGENARPKLNYPEGVAAAWADHDNEKLAGIGPRGCAWFCGDTLYSYRTPVAMFWLHQDKSDRSVWSPLHRDFVALVDEHKYSMKTNELLWAVKYQLARGIQYVEVSDVLSPYNSYKSARGDYAAAKYGFRQENPRAFKKRYKLANNARHAVHTAKTLLQLFPSMLRSVPELPHDEDFFVESQASVDLYNAYCANLEARREERRRLANESYEYREAHKALREHG